MSKITDQEEVLRLMREGWEFGHSYGYRPGCRSRYWLQKPGLCRGGESKEVHGATGNRMVRRGVVKAVKPDGGPFWLMKLEVAA